MAVVPYSSDVLCMHKTRLQLLYTDVQQLKKVQMVSQPHYSAIFIYRSDALPLLHNITCTKFFQNFVQKESNRLTFGAVALIFIPHPLEFFDGAV